MAAGWVLMTRKTYGSRICELSKANVFVDLSFFSFVKSPIVDSDSQSRLSYSSSLRNET